MRTLAASLSILCTALCIVWAGVSPREAQAQQQQPGDLVKAPGAELSVSMVELGSEPRQPLRISLSKGAGFRYQLTSDYGIEQSVNGEPAPPQIFPTSRFVIELLVTNVVPDEKIACDLLCVEADVIGGPNYGEDVLGFLRSFIAPVVGLRGKLVMTTRGYITHLSIQTPNDFNPISASYLQALEQGLRATSTPLPIEPVGVGAQWRATMPMAQGNVPVQQTALYTLTAVDGNRIEIDAQITQQADDQHIESTDKSLLAMNVKSVRSKGAGSYKLQLDQLLPEHASSTLKAEIEALLLTHPEPTELTQKINTTIQGAAVPSPQPAPAPPADSDSNSDVNKAS